MRKNRIGLLSCFFGKKPWYFGYFLHSCKFNPKVDFIIIADDPGIGEAIAMANCKHILFIRRNLAEISSIISDKTGIPVNIEWGYKLCDFKPTYGFIFEDLLKSYDFWGHCDIDIIFGDIKGFITDALLKKYDLISVRHDWLTGCFLLYRNSEFMNTLFFKSKDYKKVFTSSTHYCFDETNFAHEAFAKGLHYRDVATEIESFMHVVKKYEELGQVKPYFDQFIVEGIPGKILWDNGKLFYKSFEILFYHLIHFKKEQPRLVNLKRIPQKFRISKSRIYN